MIRGVGRAIARDPWRGPCDRGGSGPCAVRSRGIRGVGRANSGGPAGGRGRPAGPPVVCLAYVPLWKSGNSGGPAGGRPRPGGGAPGARHVFRDFNCSLGAFPAKTPRIRPPGEGLDESSTPIYFPIIPSPPRFSAKMVAFGLTFSDPILNVPNKCSK